MLCSFARWTYPKRSTNFFYYIVNCGTKAHVDFVFNAFEAFKRGDKGAEHLLATYALEMGSVFGDNKRLIQNLIRIAPNANTDVQFKLATMYEDGCGVKSNPEKAFYWFNIAAERGLAIAQYKVALYYESGTFVSQNYEKALYWFQKAANQGIVEAQYKVGFCYENGCGVRKNIPEAVRWYQKAAAQKHEEAIAKVEELVDAK